MAQFFRRIARSILRLIPGANNSEPVKVIDCVDFQDPENLCKHIYYINYQGKLKFRCLYAAGSIKGVVEYTAKEKEEMKMPLDCIAIDWGVEYVEFNEE